MTHPLEHTWAVAVFCLTAVGTSIVFLAWHHDENRAARDSECSQACELMDGAFAAANRYGCFCRDEALGGDVFTLSPEADVE